MLGLRCTDNEVVLDGEIWQSRLPSLIEAVFFPIHGNVKHWEGGGDPSGARNLRDRFASMHGISPPDRVPVLTYDLAEAEAGRAPFREL